MERKFAVIENNRVVNIVINVPEEELSTNPGKYIEYTNGWDYDNGIEGGKYFPPQSTPEPVE